MFPGDEFVLSPNDGNVILGPGLRLKPVIDETLKIAKVCKPGFLSKTKPNNFYISMGTKNYNPFKKEDVVGIINKKSGDQYVVDFGTRDRVTLSKFAFEGATKKNKPDLKIGDVVFGRFLELPQDYPFEITCVASSGKSNGLGPLEGGVVFQIPVHLVQTLQTSNKLGGSELLKKFGDITAFETAVGANGFVWASSKSPLTNVLISLAVQSAADLRPDEHECLVPLFTDSVRAIGGHS